MLNSKNLDLNKLVEYVSTNCLYKSFNGQARFNGRLKSTGGRYMTKNNCIEINPKMLDEFSLTNLVKIVKHELCHWYLYNVRHVGLKRSGHGKEFKELLNQIGGSRYAPMTKEQKNKWNYEYICTHCGQLYKRVRMINTDKYVCGQCKHQIKLNKVF